MKSGISVIIPTYNRKHSLKEALVAVLEQWTKNYEVIVIDDGSTDGTVQLLQEMKKAYKNLRFFTQPNQGPAAARNLGISHAKGQIIAFTDDDCEVSKTWVLMIRKSFELNPEVVALQGRTTTDREKITPFTHQIDNEHGFNTIPTCNAAYRMETLNKLGGFDTSFPFPHNEDADLAWRAAEIGKVMFVPEMTVHHPPRLDSFKKVSKRMRILESEFMLYYKNPALYKKNRAESPWKTIYYNVGIKTHFYYLKSRFKFISRPLIMLNGIRLSLYWWWELIKLFPHFLKVDRELADNK